MFAFALFAVTVLLLLRIIVMYLYPVKGSSKATTVPGLDPSDSKDGNFTEIKGAGSLHEFLMDLHSKFGEIASFWMGTQLTVSIASPKLFAEHNKVFDRAGLLFEQFLPLFTKDSITYANGLDGRSRRKTYDRSYSHEAVASYYSLLQQEADELVVKLSSLISEDHIPLKQYMLAVSLKSMAKVSFGKYFNDDSKITELHKNYDLCWSEMERRVVHNDYDPDENSPRQKEFEKGLAGWRKTIKEVLEQRKQMPQSEKDVKFIDVIVGSGASEERILADSITYMIAGFHTTGNMLTWCLYFLAIHPDVQDKVHAELTDVLDEEPVTAESAKELVYMKQVIDETMRCSVLAPVAARVQDVDSELGGHVIPKNAPVIQALGVVLQDETLWPDPSRFDPDRFSEENKKTRPNFSFEPFGFAGKRKCPGYRFVYAEGMVFLSTLLRKFEFKLVDGQVVTPMFGLVTAPVDEIWVKVTPRKKMKQEM